MKMETLQDLFIETIQDLYSAESQIVKALPKMQKAAGDEALKDAFSTHLEESKEQLKRLEQIAQQLDTDPNGKKCKGMEGLIAEGQELIDDKPDQDVLDAGLIAAAQKIEHYEISGYGTARTYAEILDMADVADILQTTLDEESETDEKLTALAEKINLEAV